MKKICMRITDIVSLVCAGVLFVILCALFAGGLDFYETADFIYSYAGKLERILLCGLSVLFFLLLYSLLGKVLRSCSQKQQKMIVWIFLITAFVAQMYFLFYVRSCYKWDSGFVIGAADSLVHSGKVAEQAYYYMSVYPNQNTFVCITAILIRLSDMLGVAVADRTLVWNVFNTLCLDVSVALSVVLIRKIKPQISCMQLSRIILLMLCNPFLYIGVSYYYTITLSLPLTMGFLVLVCKETDRRVKNVLYWVSAGILLGVGYELRATAVISAIAVAFAGLRKMLAVPKNEYKKTGLKFLVLTVTTVLVMTGIDSIQKKYIGINTEDTAFPATHWMMMSLTGEGAHNAEDEAYTASFATKEEKAAAVKERLYSKIENMSFAEYGQLIKHKVQNTFGNGMNGYSTFLAEALRTDGIYDAVFGEHKDFVILWHQGYYLFLVAGILLQIWKWMRYQVWLMKNKEPGAVSLAGEAEIFLLLLILFGAILFYVLWEAGEQYSVPFMMIMMILGLMPDEAREGEAENLQYKRYSLKSCNTTVLRGLSFGAALIVLVWGCMRFSVFTKEEHAVSYKAAIQIMANTPLTVDDGETLCQTVEVKRPFNRLVIQWRNPYMEESSAQYCVQLREKESGKVIYSADIEAEGTPYNGAGIYDFETVIPKTERYEIVIYKTGGQAEHDLGFVVYDMPGFTPYALGQLTKYGKAEEKLTASLLFSISEETTEAYTAAQTYVIVIAFIMLFFLFVGIWNKGEKNGSER